MSGSSGLLALVATFAVVACSACGGARGPVVAPESDPWAGYKGTYATASAGQTAPASVAEAKPKSAPANDTKSMVAMASDAKADDLTPETAPAPAPKKAMKKRAGAVAGKKTVAKKSAQH